MAWVSSQMKERRKRREGGESAAANRERGSDNEWY